MRHTPLKIACLCLLFVALWFNSHFWFRDVNTSAGLFRRETLVIVVDALFITISICLLYYLLRKSNHSLQYEQLFFLHPIPMWLYDKNSLRFIDVNKAAIEKYGYTAKEFRNMTLMDIRDPAETDRLLENIKLRCNGVEYRGIWKHRKKDGSHFYVEIYAHSGKYHGKEVRVIMAKDVDEQVKATIEARELGVRYELLAQATHDAIYDRNLLSGEVVWNHGLSSLFGYHEKDGAENMLWWEDKVHPDDVDRVKASLDNCVACKLRYWSMEYRFRCDNNEYRYVFDRGHVIYDNKNFMPLRMIGVMQDISEKKQYIQQLQEQNQALREIAWINSHEIRRPVVSILSITSMFDKNNEDIQLNSRLMEWLQISTVELDEIIHKIEHRVNSMQ